MHMADALVAPAVAATMYTCSAVAAGYSVKKVKLVDDPKRIPVMGVMGAFVFATQMINFTIPGTGSSGHLCGGMLLSAILGPYAGFLTMIGVLLIQCLLFADGGILALGCNIWNMAFYGCFIGAMLIAASVIGCIVTLQLGAFSVCLETTASGVTQLPLTVFVSVMQPIHLAIGAVEGLITAAVLCFIYEARPELLWGINDGVDKKPGLSYKKTVIILVTAAAVIGGGLSLAASEYPDGLEWSIQKITGEDEIEASDGIYEAAASVQEKTALLPDYSVKTTDSQAGTSLSGIVGGAAVIALCSLFCVMFRLFRRKHE